MSKLDDILDDLSLPPHQSGSTKGRMYSSRFNHKELKHSFKALMLDLIDNTGVYRSEIGHWTVDSETLKKKVEEL